MSDDPRPSTFKDIPFFHAVLAWTRSMRLYHRHKAHGLRNIPKTGRALIVVNHSFATYDILLLGDAIYSRTKRYARTLIDKVFFIFPILEDVLISRMGLSKATWENAKKLLNNQEIVVVAPGGMREWRKSHKKRYSIDWDNRYGFARLAIETQTPVILAACPKADNIYKVYNSMISNAMYGKFRAPLVFFRGLGPTNLPKPVKLTHYLSEPLQPPPLGEGEDIDALIHTFQTQCRDKMEAMLKSAA